MSDRDNDYPYDYPNPGPLGGDPRFPGHGYPPRRGEDRPAGSPWGRLCRGGAIGKKANFVYDAGNLRAQKSEEFLRVAGDDADAQQITLTIAPPLVVPQLFTTLLRNNPSNVTGEKDNAQDAFVNFPGTARPTIWPPIEAVINWGVGGTSVSAVVDIVNGATVNVVASFIKVYAQVPDLTRADLSLTSAVYVVSAFVGPGFPRPGTAQSTVNVGEIESLDESGVFAIPRFAKTAYVIGCDPEAGPDVNASVGTIRFWRSSDGVVGGDNVGNFICSGAQPQGFDVPGGAAYASILSGMAVDARFLIVYNLAI